MTWSSAVAGIASHRKGRAASAACIVAVSALAGCASGSGGGSGAEPGLFTKAMEAVGLSKPAVPDLPVKALPTLNRKLTLRLHAGTVLNTDPAGRSLAVVVRVYKLRDAAAFQRTPYEAFQGNAAAKDVPFVQDVVEVREVVLSTGTTNDVIETLTPEARYVAVVGLFRAPAESRWRFVFDSAAAVAAGGITLGAHGCALSVGQGQPLDTTAETARLAGVRCR